MQNQWWIWSCVYNKENYNEILNQIWQYLRMIPYISNTRWGAIFELMFRELTNIKDGKVDFYKEKLRQVFPSAFFCILLSSAGNFFIISNSKNVCRLCERRVMCYMDHFNWFEIAQTKLSLIDVTSNLAERRNKSLKNHWDKAPFCKRNIDLARETRNWFMVHSFDYIIEDREVRIKKDDKIRREELLKLLEFQFRNVSCSNQQLYSFMQGLRKF